MSTMLHTLDSMLGNASPAVLTVVSLLTGGIVAWVFLWGHRIALRLYRQCLRMFGALRSPREAHEPEHSLTNDAVKSSPCISTQKPASAMWSSSNVTAAVTLASLSESQKADVLSAWKQTRQAGNMAVSGTATGYGSVHVSYTNPGQRSGSLTSFGPEREN